MTLSELQAYLQQGVSILSNPSQSAVAASGAAGVFSAEFNNLRQQAQIDLQKFGSKIPAPLQGVAASIFKPLQNILGGNPANPIPQNPTGTVFGFSYLNAILVSAGLLIVGVFLIGRGSK